MRRCLKSHGLKAVVKKNKPLLTKHHIRQRLEFAERYQHWTLDDWKRVVWSDETMINRFGSDGRKWHWKKPGIQILPQHIQPTVKYDGGSVLIWGYMTASGAGFICLIEAKMDTKVYVQITYVLFIAV